MCTAFLEYESTNGLLTFCKKKKKKKTDGKKKFYKKYVSGKNCFMIYVENASGFYCLKYFY